MRNLFFEGRGIRKDFAGKSKKRQVRVLPSVLRELRFAAGFAQELLGGEVVVEGDLRKKQAALAAPRYQKTVAANFDLQGGELFRAHSGEARVVEGGACGATHDGVAKGLVCFYHADAAAQMLLDMESHKHAALFGANPMRGYL